MSSRTHTFTVDNIGSDELIRIQGEGGCTEVEIYENAQSGTLDYTIRAPLSTNLAVTRLAGSRTTFRTPPGVRWMKDEIIGYVAAVGGTMTMAQVETG